MKKIILLFALIASVGGSPAQASVKCSYDNINNSKSCYDSETGETCKTRYDKINNSSETDCN